MNEYNPDCEIEFSEYFCKGMMDEKLLPTNVLFDEATFKLNGTVNRQLCVLHQQKSMRNRIMSSYSTRGVSAKYFVYQKTDRATFL
jgi:hypothetical protein